MTVNDYFNDPDRPGFLEFGQAIDKLCSAATGLGLLDIADQDYSSMFEDGLTAEEAWEQIAEEEFGNFDSADFD